MRALRLKPGRIFFLEGLPGSGKTSIIQHLKTSYHVVEEVLNKSQLARCHNKRHQDFFFANDERKIAKAKQASGVVLIDRSPLSTLYFNLAKFVFNFNYNPGDVLNWFACQIKPEFESGDFRFIFLDISPGLALKRKSRKETKNDPWANRQALEMIRNMYLSFMHLHKDLTAVVDGGQNFSEVLSDVKNVILSQNE